MPISALPDAPSPGDTPTQFNSKAFAFLAALSTFRTEANALETAVDADAVSAAASASTATTQAGIATTQAGNAAASASAASASATSASGAATSAINAFDSFDDRYLGAKASDPTLDNDGNALLTGALYYKTGSGMRVWNGSAWEAAYVPTAGMLTTSDIGATVQAYDADLTAWAGKTAPSGDAVGTTDTQTLANKTIVENVQVISTNTAAARGRTYVLTASLTLTLPATPAAGDSLVVINRSTTTTAVIARNGSNIMGLAEDMTLDNSVAAFSLVYADATRGWVIY